MEVRLHARSNAATLIHHTMHCHSFLRWRTKEECKSRKDHGMLVTASNQNPDSACRFLLATRRQSST
jgi:hypothetical protein